MGRSLNKAEVLRWLERGGTRANVRGMARYGIHSTRAFGVSMGTMQTLAKRIGRDHVLAGSLWASGWHEARMLAVLVDDPARVTRRQMDAWARDFDNWAICDTACFRLFDRSPYAWDKARRWAASPREFVRRAGFALIASLALHDKTAPDARFRVMLPLIERGARDGRNFVKKGVSWALRSIGRRSPSLHGSALAAARRLARSGAASCRWVAADAVRDLTRATVRARLSRTREPPVGATRRRPGRR